MNMLVKTMLQISRTLVSSSGCGCSGRDGVRALVMGKSIIFVSQIYTIHEKGQRAAQIYTLPFDGLYQVFSFKLIPSAVPLPVTHQDNLGF